MTTKDANVKQSMQTAITQILHFTKSEKPDGTSEPTYLYYFAKK